MLGTTLQRFWMVVIILILSTNGYAQVRCDRFEIATKLDGHTLTVSLDADLPDETTLMVSVNRIYWQTGSGDSYSESYISGRFTVGEWRSPRKIDVLDEIWQQALQERQQLLDRMGMPFKVKKISEDIEVSFTIPVNQKDSRFGRRNKNLTGTMVTISSTNLRIVEATKNIRLPLGVLSDKASSITQDSYRQLGGVEDLSHAKAKRLSFRIEVPLHRTRKEIEATLKKSVLDLYKKRQSRPKAISVFAYMPGDDFESAFTVGKAIYAPNGKWEDATKRGTMKFSFDIGTVYFDVSKLTEQFASGTQTQLKSPDSNFVRISQSTDDWSDRKMVASVPEGTLVEIMDHKVLAYTSGFYEIWFRVQLKQHGKKIEGWVRQNNIEN